MKLLEINLHHISVDAWQLSSLTFFLMAVDGNWSSGDKFDGLAFLSLLDIKFVAELTFYSLGHSYNFSSSLLVRAPSF